VQASQADENQLESRISEDARAGTVGISWEDIKIAFLSDERVQVELGSQGETRNYAEMGFADRRSGKPNQAWGLVRALAVARGVIPNAARDSKDFIAMEKRIERMQKTLRRHFGVSSDPIPLDSSTGYCCRFHIEYAPRSRSDSLRQGDLSALNSYVHGLNKLHELSPTAWLLRRHVPKCV